MRVSLEGRLSSILQGYPHFEREHQRGTPYIYNENRFLNRAFTAS